MSITQLRVRRYRLALFVAAVLVAAAPAGATPYDPAIRAADFGGPIDNPYFPLRPGTTLRYTGSAGGEVQRERVVVTRRTTRVLGVRCVVVLHTVTLGGEPLERTFDWYAQDRRGNVWYFGEDSRDWQAGRWVVSDGSWRAGVDGARPGLIMRARPRPGAAYRQEYYKGHAEDWARVLRNGATVTAGGRTYHRVVVTREWTPLEPNLVERKAYAPGVGEIRSEAIRGEQERGELVAVEPT